MSDHALNTDVRPAACSCGHARWAGSPTFVRTMHALHVADMTTPAKTNEPTEGASE